MKAYKGFRASDMTCRGFRFEEGKTYELPDGEVPRLCNSGFHACEAPLDCFAYYAPSESEYHEVELEDVTDETSTDSKRVGRKIKIGAKLSIRDLVLAQFEFVKEHCTNKNNAEDGQPASAVAYGAASAGYRGAASAGYRGAASAGYRGAASAGAYGAASAGDSGAASAGDSGAASAGAYGAASAGDSGAASAGAYGAAVSRGRSSAGKNGIACVRGNDISVKGDIGAILIIVVENDIDYNIKEWKAAVVDGETIKPDVWYTLKDGEFVEVEG